MGCTGVVCVHVGEGGVVELSGIQRVHPSSEEDVVSSDVTVSRPLAIDTWVVGPLIDLLENVFT